jgi:hypothetical protein
MAVKDLCPHRNICEVYQGQTISDDYKLTIHKNVFCHRGYKGWRNCNQYLIFENTADSSEEKPTNNETKTP